MLAQLTIAIVGLLGLMFIGLPIYVALLIMTFVIQTFIIGGSLVSVVAGLYDGIAKPSLLAVPFFVLAGNLIQTSSMGQRLVLMILRLLGGIRGAVPISCVLANGFFGAISGSAPAATATIGKITYPALEKTYGEKMGLGLIASTGALSAIIPPSITMIIYGIATETSVGKLFLAGIIPGIIVMAALAVYAFIKRPLGEGSQVTQSGHNSPIQGIPVILFPVIVLGGIYAGFFTPTEAGAVAAGYAFVVPLLIYRDFTLEKIKDALIDSTRVTSQLFIIIASSIVFAQALAMAQAPQMLTETLGGMNPTLFLLMLNLILLIVGMIFEPGAAILILGPIVASIGTQLGIDPIHLGLIVCFNIAIGMFTPPFGLNLFVSQAVFRKPLEVISSSVWPFLAIYIAVLLLVTFVPVLSTWLPALIG